MKSNNHKSTKQLQCKQDNLWFNKTTTLADFNSVPSDINLPRSPSWKNPTFWGTNPIHGKQNNDDRPSKWVKNKSPRLTKK